MTLDAMDWVWRHARSRGNARLVLLAIADACTGPEATVRMGTAELTRRLAAGKGVTVEAVAKALACGELEVAEAAKGSRAATYRLPAAVGYSRVSSLESGPETERSGIRTGSRLRSGIRTANNPGSGLESGPLDEDEQDALWSGFRTGSGLESGPHHSPKEGVNEGGKETRLPAGVIPDFARSLVDTLTASGVVLRWDLASAEWFALQALIERSGEPMLAAEGARLAARTTIRHARYLLRAWRDLPPAPAAGTAPVQTPPAGPGADVIPLAPQRLGRADQAAQWYAQLAQEMTARDAR